jgi:HlyD family secretion protein
MKRSALVAIAAVVAALLATSVWWGAPALSLLGLGGGHPRYLGYVEGETSLIAPPVAGRLLERPVERGGQVKKGDRLFVIDPILAKAEVARSEAALAESKSRYENLLTGKRQEEQDVVRGQRRETEAALAMAETELKRQTDLLARGYATRLA